MRMLISTVFLALILPSSLHAQGAESFAKARVESIVLERTEGEGDLQRLVQQVDVAILSGPDKGTTIHIQNGVLPGRDDMRLKEGETVVLETLQRADGTTRYLIREKYRIHWLIFLAIGFFALAAITGGWAGVRSAAGLIVSVLILTFFIVPLIVQGWNPLLISFAGSLLIAGLALYLSHGFNRRTTIALVSTVLTLAASTLMAVGSVYAAKLFGMGSEHSVFLQLGTLQHVNMRGLLLGGIVIGALGVLDDITTAQTATIDEVSRANHKLGFKELFVSGMSVGREHVASLINTLVLAYAGASMPLLLLFSINREVPIWVIANGEFMAEEIVRTLVGSATLLLAVPISTFFAAKAFAHGNHTTVNKKHACGHAH